MGGVFGGGGWEMMSLLVSLLWTTLVAWFLSGWGLHWCVFVFLGGGGFILTDWLWRKYVDN